MKTAKGKAIGIGGAALLIAGSLVTKWEGQQFVPYRDTGGVLTVCYGHTGRDVVAGREYTREQCEAWRNQDLAVAQGVVNHCLPMPKLPQIEGAFTSATFNAGGQVVCGSTLQKFALANNWPEACHQLLRWVNVNRKVSPGLENRRADEYGICIGSALWAGL